MKKVLSSILVCVMLVTVFLPANIVNANANELNNVGFQELAVKHIRENNQIVVDGTYKDQRTEDIHHFDVVDNESLFIQWVLWN